MPYSISILLLSSPPHLAASMAAALASLTSRNPLKTLILPLQSIPLARLQLPFASSTSRPRPSLRSAIHPSSDRIRSVSGKHLSPITSPSRDYEFLDGAPEVELRVDIESLGIQSSSDIFVDADETSLLIRVKSYGTLLTLMEISRLYDKIKPSETIWYIDESQLVVSMKKHDANLKWPDVMESWESLRTGIAQLLKGTSIYIIGDSTEINKKVATMLANGIGYTPLCTGDLLESIAHRSINSWVISEGADAVAEAEGLVLESLSSHVRAVVATLGGEHGAARKTEKWRCLHAGLTIWLSESEAADEASAKDEARVDIQDGTLAYSNAEVVVKLGGWDDGGAQPAAEACLSALKQLLLSEKELTEKKSLYIRLGCRGDGPNIKAPGWDPSGGVEPSS